MDLGITIRKRGLLCRYGGRGQLLKAGGPDEDLDDGREGRISWAGHLSGASSCRKYGGANGQVGMGREPIHQGEYSCRDLQDVLRLGMAGPRRRELEVPGRGVRILLQRPHRAVMGGVGAHREIPSRQGCLRKRIMGKEVAGYKGSFRTRQTC